MTAAHHIHTHSRPQVTGETLTVIAEAQYALKNLDSWAARQSVATPAFLIPGSSWTQAEPLGAVSAPCLEQQLRQLSLESVCLSPSAPPFFFPPRC